MDDSMNSVWVKEGYNSLIGNQNKTNTCTDRPNKKKTRKRKSENLNNGMKQRQQQLHMAKTLAENDEKVHLGGEMPKQFSQSLFSIWLKLSFRFRSPFIRRYTHLSVVIHYYR